MVTFTYNSEEKIVTVVFTGRMDTPAAANLNETLESEPMIKEMKADEKLVFDIGEVDYIASSFIRICVVYAKKAGQGRFSIARCQPFVKKTFKVSGLDEVLNIS